LRNTSSDSVGDRLGKGIKDRCQVFLFERIVDGWWGGFSFVDERECVNWTVKDKLSGFENFG
jgi:hypothetical protein